jgi:hypothetical protein
MPEYPTDGIGKIMGELSLQPTATPTPGNFKYENDPRFAFRVTNRDKPNLWMYVDPKGDRAEMNPATATPWVDIGMPTQLGDLKSILQNRGGTSEGDAWAPSDIAVVKELSKQTGGVANERLVELYKQHLLETRDPHFMSQHPGKAAYNEDPAERVREVIDNTDSPFAKYEKKAAAGQSVSQILKHRDDDATAKELIDEMRGNR